MDNRRKARTVENATNQCDVSMCFQENLGNFFPAGVKFEPSDEELLHHLEAEIGSASVKPHPLIKNFISVLSGEDGICQTHPEHLPGMKQDGSSRHFFHRPAKAYTTGTRKRRKIHSEDDEQGVETRWHKTGKTRSVTENGHTLGWKKIMVLYGNNGTKKAKPEKTNWILHQYHLGESEEETDGELVVCKVFFQKQPRQCTGGRQAEGADENVDLNQGSRDVSLTCLSEVSRGTTPVTPKVDTPQRPRSLRGDATAKVRGAPAQSSKGSELTVIGMETQAAAASELTSTPVPYIADATPVRPNLMRGQISTPLAMKYVPPVAEEYSAECNEPSEEVFTSGHNQAGGPIVYTGMEQDDLHQYQGTFGGESQQRYPDDDADALRCEERGVNSFLRDMDFGEFGGFDEFYCFNPNEDYPAIDVLTDSPPHLEQDYLLSSQEARDLLSSQEARDGFGGWSKPTTYTSLDNDDSLSST